MVRINPSQLVGGEVRKICGRHRAIAATALGDGGNHASSTSALMMESSRSRV
jgi:hypothetical protein